MFFPSLPFSSSSSAAFPFPFCSDLDGVSFQDLTSSRVSIVFLNRHSPLSFTSHCPSRSVLFCFFFLVCFTFPLNLTVPLPFVSSPVLSFLSLFHFSLWLVLSSPLSVPSLFFSLFSFSISLCLFCCSPPPFPLFFSRMLALEGIYRAKGSGGVPIATL